MIAVVHPVKHKDKRIHDTTSSQRHSLHDDVISRAGHLSGEVTLGSISKCLPGHGSCSCTQNTIINTIKWSPAAFRKNMVYSWTCCVLSNFKYNGRQG